MSDRSVALIVVVDAVGVETLEYLLDKYQEKISMPNFSRLGLGSLLDKRFASRFSPHDGKGLSVRLTQTSASADSVIGHREMMGIMDDRTYDLFPEGFPARYIKELEKRIGVGTIFNRMAGGMEAIEVNAAEHESTGKPIVYASKCDPLIQIAMNEKVIPVERQHEIADAAFDLAMEHKIPVTRSIARAYTRNSDGDIVRTANRHDKVLPMDGKTLVDILSAAGVFTVSVGKTSDLVNTKYHDKIKITDPRLLDPELRLEFVHPKKKDTNPYSMQGIINAKAAAKNVYRPKGTFIFANLVDADSLYGHTRDVAGTIKSLEALDRAIPLIESRMEKGDLLIFTADHGMAHKSDYGYHNKEIIPLLAERKGFGSDLGGLKPGKGITLADSGWLVSQFFGLADEFSALPGCAGKFL